MPLLGVVGSKSISLVFWLVAAWCVYLENGLDKSELLRDKVSLQYDFQIYSKRKYSVSNLDFYWIGRSSSNDHGIYIRW